MKPTNIDNVKKMMQLDYTKTQSEKLSSAFCLLDQVMYELEQTRHVDEWNAVKDAREILHDIALAHSLKEDYGQRNETGMISVITKNVAEPPEIKEVGTQLKDHQAIVAGYVELVRLPHDIDMWLNEEGLLQELPLNIVTLSEGEIVHHIVGNIFFSNHNSEGETTSLSESQKNWLISRLLPYGTTKYGDKEHAVWALHVR